MILLLAAACTAGPTDADPAPDSAPDSACLTPGLYGDPSWSLTVGEDCSVLLQAFCGEGTVPALRVDAMTGSFTARLTWVWQGGGAAGGKADATFLGGVSDGVVDGTLVWDAHKDVVHAVLGVTPGAGLGVGNCPLD